MRERTVRITQVVAQTKQTGGEGGEAMMRRIVWKLGIAVAVWGVALTPGWAQQKTVKLGASWSGLNVPAYAIAAKAAQDEAKKQGVELITTDSKDQLAKQVSDIEDLITKGVGALLINPVAKGVEPIVEKAVEKGIKVIAVQRTIFSPKIHQTVATDNVEIGRVLAEWSVKKLGGKGNVVVIEGIPGASSSDDRAKGSSEVWAKHPGIKIVAKQPGMYNRAKSLAVMENILQAQKEIDLVFCYNDDMAIGVVSALRAANRKAMVVGIDAIPDAVKALERGEITATVELNLDEMGRVPVQNAIKLLRGETLPPSHRVGVRVLEKK